MVVGAPIQCDVDYVKSECCSNSFCRFSSLVDSFIGSLLLMSFSFEVIVSKISFMVASGDLKSSGELSVFFLSSNFAYLPVKAFDGVDDKWYVITRLHLL